MPRKYKASKRKSSKPKYGKRKGYKRASKYTKYGKVAAPRSRAQHVKAAQFHQESFQDPSAQSIPGTAFDSTFTLGNTVTLKAGMEFIYSASRVNDTDFVLFSNLYQWYRIDSVQVTATVNYTPSYQGVASGAVPGQVDPRTVPNYVMLWAWNDKDGIGGAGSTYDSDAANLGIKPVYLGAGKSHTWTFRPNTLRTVFAGPDALGPVYTANKPGQWLPCTTDGIQVPFYQLRMAANAVYNNRSAALALEKPDIVLKMTYNVSFKNRQSTFAEDAQAPQAQAPNPMTEDVEQLVV